MPRRRGRRAIIDCRDRMTSENEGQRVAERKRGRRSMRRSSTRRGHVHQDADRGGSRRRRCVGAAAMRPRRGRRESEPEGDRKGNRRRR